MVVGLSGEIGGIGGGGLGCWCEESDWPFWVVIGV